MRTLIESSSGRGRTTVERGSGSKAGISSRMFLNPGLLVGSSIALLAV